MNLKYNKIFGFTLMEVMIVVVLIGVIAGFALPNFSRAILKGRVRDAIQQLNAIYAASMINKARNGDFGDRTYADFNAINTGLEINIVPNTLSYTYTSDAATNTFSATASNADFTVTITQAPIDLLATPPARNPCCSAGNCGSALGLCI